MACGGDGVSGNTGHRQVLPRNALHVDGRRVGQGERAAVKAWEHRNRWVSRSFLFETRTLKQRQIEEGKIDL